MKRYRVVIETRDAYERIVEAPTAEKARQIVEAVHQIEKVE